MNTCETNEHFVFHIRITGWQVILENHSWCNDNLVLPYIIKFACTRPPKTQTQNRHRILMWPVKFRFSCWLMAVVSHKYINLWTIYYLPVLHSDQGPATPLFCPCIFLILFIHLISCFVCWFESLIAVHCPLQLHVIIYIIFVRLQENHFTSTSARLSSACRKWPLAIPWVEFV